MEKLIYLLDRGALAPAPVTRALIELVPALKQRGASQITLNVCDLDEPVRSASPNRIAGAWDKFGAAVHLWMDTLDGRSTIEALLAPLCPAMAGYLVTESMLQHAEPVWRGGQRRPGVTQFTAHAKPANVSEEDFYYNWQVLHSAISFDLHPYRCSYVRNAVARPLTKNAPAYRVIVLEHFPELRDFTEDARYFGDPKVVEEMFRDLPGFCDVNSMITGPMSEYYFD